jgi:hypothetical protein
LNSKSIGHQKKKKKVVLHLSPFINGLATLAFHQGAHQAVWVISQITTQSKLYTGQEYYR